MFSGPVCCRGSADQRLMWHHRRHGRLRRLRRRPVLNRNVRVILTLRSRSIIRTLHSIIRSLRIGLCTLRSSFSTPRSNSRARHRCEERAPSDTPCAGTCGCDGKPLELGGSGPPAAAGAVDGQTDMLSIPLESSGACIFSCSRHCTATSCEIKAPSSAHVKLPDLFRLSCAKMLRGVDLGGGLRGSASALDNVASELPNLQYLSLQGSRCLVPQPACSRGFFFFLHANP